MPIRKLSTDTSRLIGASAGITSPAAVVKELLDNAIDAGGDAVEIAISPNTLDQVRVRDNGRGINLDDLDSLGRPAHTSKLGAFAELATGRVRTLGFRGQALASIAAVADAPLQVTTKTTDEPVATRVLLDAQRGGIGKKCPPVSAPTGTTVLAQGLFGNMPARRQFLIKESKNSMGRMKELLMAYVLASADLQIVWKVLGEERQACKFGYTRDRDLKQSVLEVFGAAVAASGETHRFAETVSSERTYTLVAFLPKVAGDDVKVIAGKGSFISVNGRPISSGTVIGKALTGVFKTKMQQVWQQRGLQAVQKPLLLLEVLCRFESYDANVATMKDDVLFADADVLLRTFAKLCDTVYDKQKANSNEQVEPVSLTASAPQLVSAQMRTACTVNMIRTNSNTTDEETDFQTVEVQVPARRQIETSGNNSESLKQTMPKPTRGIARYFQPTGTDFEIATDDTATPEKPEAELNDILPSQACSPPRRRPLADMPDSTVNILDSTQDSASDVSSQGDAPRLSNLNSTSWSIQSLLNRNMLQVPSRGSTAQASPPPLVPLTRGQQDSRRQQVLQSARLPILRTPPPSDPTREERQLIAASHVVGPGTRRQPSPASSSSPQSSVPVKETRGSAEQQRREARRTLPNARNEQSRTRGFSSGTARLLGRRQPATRPRQQATAERALARRLEYENSSDAASREGGGDEEASRPELMDYGSRMRSQLQQAAAAVYRDTEDMDGDVDTGPQPKRRRSESRASMAMRQGNPHCKKPLTTENTENLPLESIPLGMATWCSILRTDISFSDVRISMELIQDLDLYVVDGSLEFGLKNITRADGVELECRLRRFYTV
ncbi:hypothetical protein PWT90_10778 [Aphanocladium album]|nr:hypothetical protein PWT90_10778 [Aphanocladium album]